jgi:preprotein translocase subunit SecE
VAKTVKGKQTKASGKAGGDKAAKSANAKGAGVKKASAKGSPAKRQRPTARSGRTEKKGGFGKFLRDVRVELSKVTWPTRSDLTQSTIVVLVAVAIATIYTGVLDFVFHQVMRVLIPN